MVGFFWGKSLGRGLGRARRGRGGIVGRGHRPNLEALEVRLTLSTATWTGLGTDSNWMTADNWSGDTAPVAGDNLVFPAGVTNLGPVNNFPAGTSFNTITIAGPSYQLTGNAMNLAADIDTTYTSGTSSDAIATDLVAGTVSVAPSGTLDLTGALSGSAGLALSGGGTLDLQGTNSYTGTTTITGPTTTLLVDDTIGTVENLQGVLGGNGTVGEVTNVGATVSPGHSPSPGVLTTGSLTLDSNSTFDTVLDGTSPGNGTTGYSQVDASGAVTLDGATLDATLGSTYSPTAGDTLTIIDNMSGSPVTGIFAGLAQGAILTVSGTRFSISYTGGTSGNSVVLTALAATTTTTVSPVTTSPALGQSVTLTATVAATSTSVGTPSGTVEFEINGTDAGTGTLNTSGVATFTTTSLNIGSNTVIAVYQGNTDFATSTSAPVTVTVAQAATTTTVTSSSPLAVAGQPVTFTAQVTPVISSVGTPTGSVTFYTDDTPIGTGSLDAATGVATFTTSTLGFGPQSITAVYSGDSTFGTSISSSIEEYITAAGTQPTLTVEAVRNRRGKIIAAELVANIGVISPGTGTPEGNVTFFVNGRAMYQVAPVVDGTATLALLPPRVTNKFIFVRYLGFYNIFQPSVSTSQLVSQRSLAKGPSVRESVSRARTDAESKADVHLPVRVVKVVHRRDDRRHN
jgi:autotransporter-associated beta strand protein